MAKVNGSGLRTPDWQLLLEVYVDRARAEPFVWGAHDCVSFAMGWVEMVRADLAPRDDLAEVLGYSTAAGAARMLAERSLAQAVADWGGLTAVAPAFAQRGDLVLVEIDGRESLALCVGDVVAGPGTEGLAFAPLAAVRAAWRV